MYSSSLFLYFFSNAYCTVTPSSSMFAKSFTSSIWIPNSGPYDWLVIFSSFKSLIHFKKSFCVVLEVYIAFLLQAFKWFLSVLSPELALNSNSSLELPFLKLLVLPLYLWPLIPIPYLPQNSKQLIIDVKMPLFSSKFSFLFPILWRQYLFLVCSSFLWIRLIVP